MNKILGQEMVVAMGKVKPNTWNPKDSIKENPTVAKIYEKIKEEISKKGLFEAITVRELGDGYEILDGFHRYTACKELGFKEIRINNLGKIDDRMARAITVVKEQKKVPVSELGIADIVGWYEEEGVGEDIVQDLLGYDEQEFKEYSTLFGFDLKELHEELGDSDNNSDMDSDIRTKDSDIKKGLNKHSDIEVTCPECGCRFSL